MNRTISKITPTQGRRVSKELGKTAGQLRIENEEIEWGLPKLQTNAQQNR